MADLTIQRGDFGFYVDGTITNADESVFNLTGYTLTFSAWEQGKWKHPFVEGSATTVIATAGTWKYLIVENDFTIPGNDYFVSVKATKAGAEEKTQNYSLEVKEAP